MRIECIERLDYSGDYHDQHRNDQGVEHFKDIRQCFMPSKVWMGGSNHSLCENEIDDEEEENACRDENLGCDSDLNVVWIVCPNDTLQCD